MPMATPVWLEGHEAAVKAITFVGPDLIASGGDDHQLILWDKDTGAIRHRLTGHEGKIMAIAASPDGLLIASASWDNRIGIWSAETGAHLRWLTGHKGNVNDVAFTSSGTLFSASYDGSIREWRVSDGTQLRALARHGFGVNAIVLNEAAGWLAYGALDGGTRALRLSDGDVIADMTLDRRPVLAMAMRSDGAEIAVGDGEGFIMVVNTNDWTISRDFRAAKRGPIWALSYVDNGSAVIAGGIEDSAYVFPVGDGPAQPKMAEAPPGFHVDPATVSNGERQFRRKCSVCHDLTTEGGRKAGPTLFAIFGRPAGFVEGYQYSDALQGADLIWSAETIDKLFDLGPDHFTPGSKMPMQRIVKAADRADLIEFLREATKP